MRIESSTVLERQLQGRPPVRYRRDRSPLSARSPPSRSQRAATSQLTRAADLQGISCFVGGRSVRQRELRSLFSNPDSHSGWYENRGDATTGRQGLAAYHRCRNAAEFARYGGVQNGLSLSPRLLERAPRRCRSSPASRMKPRLQSAGCRARAGARPGSVPVRPVIMRSSGGIIREIHVGTRNEDS